MKYLFITAPFFFAGYLHAAEPVTISSQVLSSVLSFENFNAPATVTPLNKPQLAAEISGQVISLPIKVGTIVKKGQLIAELDCRLYQSKEEGSSAALSRSNAQLIFSKAQLKRTENLKKKNNISTEIFEQRRTDVQQAQAEHRNQKAQLIQSQLNTKYCSIHAPFNALLSKRLISEGSYANIGTPLLELIQLDELEVDARLRTGLARTLLHAKQPYFNYQGNNYALSLRALPNFVDEKTRTRQARLSFNQQSAPIGAAGRLKWTSSQQRLPANYLVRRGSQLGVFLVRNNKAFFAVIKNAQEGQATSIEINPSELLIIEGRHRLQHGDTITHVTKNIREPSE